MAGYYLARAGKRVALFERKLSIGGGLSGSGMMFNSIVVQEAVNTCWMNLILKVRNMPKAIMFSMRWILQRP